MVVMEINLSYGFAITYFPLPTKLKQLVVRLTLAIALCRLRRSDGSSDFIGRNAHFTTTKI